MNIFTALCGEFKQRQKTWSGGGTAEEGGSTPGEEQGLPHPTSFIHRQGTL